jgi:hypothetical protein
MRRIILMLLLSSITCSLFSQEDSLLKNFKFRNIRYRAISMNLDGGTQYSKAKLVLNDSKSSGSSVSAGASYYYLKSTDKVLLNVFSNLSAGFNSSKSESSNEYKSNNYFLYPRVSVSNKWFSRKFFFELGTDLMASLYNTKNTQSSPVYNQKNKMGDESVSVTVGVGKGRLENITDMQNALWLNRTLEKESRLSRPLSYDELNDLGRAITAANNTRVLDARKRTQYILETIDNYFQNKGLINKTDIKYFSNLNDVVFFAINLPRLSGTEIFARVTPGLTNHDETFTEKIANIKNTKEVTTRSIQLSAGINNYSPVNLKHQNNFGASAELRSFYHHFTEKNFIGGILNNETDFKPNIQQGALDLFYEHAFYPNTRTVVNFRLDSETGLQDIGDDPEFFGTADLSGTFNYFISYRTRLTASLGVHYHNNTYNVTSSYFSILPETIAFFANAGVQINL